MLYTWAVSRHTWAGAWWMSNSMNICCCKEEENSAELMISNWDKLASLNQSATASMMHKKKFESLQFQDNWAAADKDYVTWLKASKINMDLEVRFFFFVKYLQFAMLKYTWERNKTWRCFPYRGTESHPKDAGSKQDEFHLESVRNISWVFRPDNIQSITWNTI